MKIEAGKIIEATRTEVYNVWLTEEWDEIMTFPDFLLTMEIIGVTITKEGQKDADKETTLPT